MIETAYRSAGLALSQPVALQDYPRYKEFSTWMKVADVVTPLDPEQPVYSPGNEQEGLWASDRLETVVQVSDPYVMIRTAQAIEARSKTSPIMQVDHETPSDETTEQLPVIQPALHEDFDVDESPRDVIQIPISDNVLPLNAAPSKD